MGPGRCIRGSSSSSSRTQWLCGCSSDQHQEARSSAEPCPHARWLTTRRSLVAVGQLLQQAPAWLNATAAFDSAHHQLVRRVGCVSKHAAALTFLQDILTELQALQQGGPAALTDASAASASPAPAAPSDAAADTSSGGVPEPAAAAAAAGAGWGEMPATPETLQKLQQQVSGLLLKYQPILEECRAAEASANSAALASALRTFVGDGCGASGWLVAGLQDVGAAVRAACPQSFACNEPTCSSMEGVSESVDVKKCGACKVCLVTSQLV